MFSSLINKIRDAFKSGPKDEISLPSNVNLADTPAENVSEKQQRPPRVPFRRSDDSISVRVDGRQYTIHSSQAVFKLLEEALKKDHHDLEEIRSYVDLRSFVSKVTVGAIQVVGDTVLFDGRPVSGYVAELLVRFISEGEDITPYALFLESALRNPSFDAVDDLFKFIEKHQMPLLPDGRFIAFKNVRNDYRDHHTGTFDNKIGQRPSMPRGSCNHNRNETCSTGLHVCAPEYLSSFYLGKSRTMVLACAAEDVVSVPTDYNNAKMRMTSYEVIAETTPTKARNTEFGVLVDWEVPQNSVDTTAEAARSTDYYSLAPSRVSKNVVRSLYENTDDKSALAASLFVSVDSLRTWLDVTGMYLEPSASAEDDTSLAASSRIDDSVFSEQLLQSLDGLFSGTDLEVLAGIAFSEDEELEETFSDEAESLAELAEDGDDDVEEDQPVSSQLVFTRGDRSWTDKELSSLVAEHGQRGTGKLTGIPRSTLQGWLKQIGDN